MPINFCHSYGREHIMVSSTGYVILSICFVHALFATLPLISQTVWALQRNASKQNWGCPRMLFGGCSHALKWSTESVRCGDACDDCMTWVWRPPNGCIAMTCCSISASQNNAACPLDGPQDENESAPQQQGPRAVDWDNNRWDDRYMVVFLQCGAV